MKNKIILIVGILFVVCLLALIIASHVLLKDDNAGFTGDFSGKKETASSDLSPREPASALPEPVGPDKTGDALMSDTEDESGFESPEAPSEPLVYTPRVLTDEQREENRREIARMKEALPGNMWIPEEPAFGSELEQAEKLRKSIELGDRIRKKTATREEKIEYYQFQIRSARDKADLIRYIADRTRELANAGEEAHLSPSDISTGKDQIESLKRMIADYERNLTEAENLPAE